MNALTPRASELRTTIEEYIGRRTDELKNRMRGLTFSLIRDLNTTRNMIADVKIQLNNQITRIGADREDQFRRGIANSAQAVGNSIQLFHLFENLTKPYALILGGISATFGLLAAANFYNCVVCKDTLIALRGSLTTIQTLENYVEEVNELTTQAEALYLGGQ